MYTSEQVGFLPVDERIDPPDRAGLVETILEVWCDRIYTKSFYSPADGDTIIDAGANVGLFSILITRLNPRCRVIAFEPSPANFLALRHNIDAARASSVETHQVGLSGLVGLGQMTESGHRSLDHRLDSVVHSLEPAGGRDIQITDLPGSLAISHSDSIALYKIDIEGSEYDLFESVTVVDLKKVVRFVIEYHDNIRPGTLDLIRARLASTHDLRISPVGEHAYGMIYAKLKSAWSAAYPCASDRRGNP